MLGLLVDASSNCITASNERVGELYALICSIFSASQNVLACKLAQPTCTISSMWMALGPVAVLQCHALNAHINYLGQCDANCIQAHVGCLGRCDANCMQVHVNWLGLCDANFVTCDNALRYAFGKRTLKNFMASPSGPNQLVLQFLHGQILVVLATCLFFAVFLVQILYFRFVCCKSFLERLLRPSTLIFPLFKNRIRSRDDLMCE